MHIHVISLNLHLVLAHTIDGLLISPDTNPKAALLPELLVAFPTKAVNDTALKESMSLCSIFFFLNSTSSCFPNLVVKLTQPYTCEVLNRLSYDKVRLQVDFACENNKSNWFEEKRPFSSLHLAAAVLVTSPNVKS